MIRLSGAAALLGASLLLSACGTWWTMRVEKTDETQTVEPAGNTVITETWTYADGEEVKTKRIIDKHGNETKRTYPPPKKFFVD